MDVGIRPVIAEDVQYLAPRLRQADKDEVLAVAGMPVELALPECVELSRLCWTCTGLSGEPVAIVGVQDVADIPQLGWVWMLCTDVIEKYPFHFVRATRAFLPVLHQHHPIITNHVDERNAVHIRYLRYMGFSFIRRIERWGAESRPFLEFARLQPCASEFFHS